MATQHTTLAYAGRPLSPRRRVRGIVLSDDDLRAVLKKTKGVLHVTGVKKGARLWIRERYVMASVSPYSKLARGRYDIDGEWFYAPSADCDHPMGFNHLDKREVPGSRMSRWASRVLIEVVNVLEGRIKFRRIES